MEKHIPSIIWYRIPPYQGENHQQVYPDMYLAGQQIADCVDMVIAAPHEICTENFLESGCFNDYQHACYHAKYLMTQFCRALLFLNKHSQDNSKDKWVSIPIQDYSEP